MPEHDVITDPDIHEPKGVAAASHRDMYMADGAGSGAWQRSAMSDHAEMAITNNVTAQAVPLATDSTLKTDSDYVKIDTGWAVGHNEGVTFNTDELVANVDGDYRVTFWSSMKVPQNNNFIGLKYAIDNNTPYSLQRIVSQSTTTNDYLNLFAAGIVTLAAGQSISVYIAASKADNVVIEEAGMQLWLIHET